MKQYTQHGRVSTFEHSLNVANLSCKICTTLAIPVHGKELIRGAMLHDYFLYDWHHHDKPWHGYTHPETAAVNAERDFNLSELESMIIRTHMWPLTIRQIPSSREAVIVCIADKICSVAETFALERF